MHSKNKPAMTKAEREHVTAVKELPCSVCDRCGPSEAHEPVQGLWYLSIALCPDCHRGSVNGLHGQKVMWRLRKLDEWSALNITLERLYAARRQAGR